MPTNAARIRLSPTGILPGFGLTLGVTVTYLTLLVIVPFTALLMHSAGMSAAKWWDLISSARVLASLRLSFGTSLVAALVNVICGVLLAWVLVRYSFPGRRIIDALVDFPFALPTAVAGIALTTIYGPNGLLGSALRDLNIKVAFSPLGITLALVFVGFPFVVRSVQPVLEDLSIDYEEAAATLGASRWQAFTKIIVPAIVPSVLTGFSLSLARGIGEYGSVVFISGNMPFKTEITPLLIMTKLEQFDYEGATALATIMMAISLVMLLAVNRLQLTIERRQHR